MLFLRNQAGCSPVTKSLMGYLSGTSFNSKHTLGFLVSTEHNNVPCFIFKKRKEKKKDGS